MVFGDAAPRWASRATMILWIWNCAAIAGCDRAPREPVRAPATDPEPSPDSPTGGGASEAGSSGGMGSPTEACVVPRAEPPPPDVSSLDECPDDPNGRPDMPYGTVTFPEAHEAPSLRVELALNDQDRAHGLMYRPTLGDDEGMLFSWTDERQRSFWMKNTCLALDMLFIAGDGTISGILENVPPWNESPSRTVPCPAAHVLEVRAGWTRTYGVQPGQRLVVSEAAE